MNVEWQNGEQEDEQPEPVMTDLEESTHDVDDE